MVKEIYNGQYIVSSFKIYQQYLVCFLCTNWVKYNHIDSISHEYVENMLTQYIIIITQYILNITIRVLLNYLLITFFVKFKECQVLTNGEHCGYITQQLFNALIIYWAGRL